MRISDWSSDVCSSDLEDLKTLFATEFSNYDVPAVTRILQDPDNQISLGDAGAHLSFLCEAGFGLHLLGRWVRDLDVLDLAEAARRLSGQQRSEERRVGTECVSTCRSRRSPYH